MTNIAVPFAYRACTACVAYVLAHQAVLPWMQATMVVADAKESLTITGNGDVVEPHDGVVGALSSLADMCRGHSSWSCTCKPGAMPILCLNCHQPPSTHHSQVTYEDGR